MRTMRALLVLVLAGASAVEAQNSNAIPHPLEGAWSRVAETVDGNVVANQPGFRMFVDGHYSMVRVEGLVARTPAPAQGATAAQVRAALQLFTGQAGKHEVTSMQTVTQRPEVAYVPANMRPGLYNSSIYHIV